MFRPLFKSQLKAVTAFQSRILPVRAASSFIQKLDAAIEALPHREAVRYEYKNQKFSAEQLNVRWIESWIASFMVTFFYLYDVCHSSHSTNRNTRKLMLMLSWNMGLNLERRFLFGCQRLLRRFSIAFD